MTMLRTNFAELLEPGLRKVFLNELNRWDKEYDKILKVSSSKKAFEEDLLVTGLGTMPQKLEGVGVTYSDLAQGYLTRYTHNTFAGAIRVTQEMYEDDLYKIMGDLTGALARSAMQRKEVDAANVLNRAFNAGFPGTDTVSLINAAHPLSVGGTQSNAFTAHADLSAASLQDAIEILESAQDERGLHVALKAKLLVVPVQEQWTAYELTKSEFKPGTADNEVNALLAKGLQFTVNHYLTDPDAFFVLADEHKLNMFERVPLQFFRGNDFDTQDAKFMARMRYSLGWTDFRGCTGDSGA